MSAADRRVVGSIRRGGLPRLAEPFGNDYGAGPVTLDRLTPQEVDDDRDLDRTKLPIRMPRFSGVANRTLDGSEPDWESIGHVEAPDGAPNVLVVLIDDAGFGNPGTFGGPVETPNYTRMAEGGLKYNRFHVTALCSPTRASLLTGRNNHAVGFGSVGEFSDGVSRATPASFRTTARPSRGS